MNHLRYTILFLLLPIAFFAQNEEIDSLKKVLATAKSDTNKATTLTSLSWELINTGQYEEAQKCAEEALALSASWPRGKAIAYNDIGYTYMYRGQFEKSLEFFEKAYDTDKALHNAGGMSAELGSMGGVYSSMGNYPRSLDNYFKGLRLAEEAGLKAWVTKHQSNIGVVYMQQNEFDKALDYFFKALQGFSASGGERAAAPALGNIGVVYERQGKHALALTYFLRALKVAEETGDKFRMTLWYENSGVALEGQGDSAIAKGNPSYANNDRYPKALEFYQKALSTAEEIGDNMGIGADNGYLGTLYLKMKDLRKAEKYLLKAKEICDSVGVPDLAKDQYKNLSQLYEEMKRPKEAFEYYRQYIALKDSVSNEANTQQSVRLEMNYEFEKKEAAARLEQEKKDALAASSKRRQNIILAAVSCFGLLILAFAAFAWRSYRQKQKANEEITRQRDIIQEKQKEILDSIYYAKRIQTSLMSHPAYIGKSLNRLKNP